MKRIFLAILVLAFASSLCFAQQAPAPVSKPAQQVPVETKTLTGKVDSVTIADATKGTKKENKSQLAVIADNGEKLMFVVRGDTPIADKDGKAIILSDIKNGNKVTVEYTNKKAGAANKAQSIKLLE